MVPPLPSPDVPENRAVFAGSVVLPNAAGCNPPLIETEPPVTAMEPASTLPEVRASMSELTIEALPDALTVTVAGAGDTRPSAATVVSIVAPLSDTLTPVSVTVPAGPPAPLTVDELTIVLLPAVPGIPTTLTVPKSAVS